MDKLTEIKEKLNVIYKEYKDNKSHLTSSKVDRAAKLIVEMTLSNNADLTNVASELSRFPAEVAGKYFDYLTKSSAITLEVLDEILKEFLLTSKDANKSKYYAHKFCFSVTAIIKNCRDKALKSTQLPQLVVFIAQFVVKNDKNKNKFYNLINNSYGEIFKLDYSCINQKSLTNIWNVVNRIYPDLSKAKYESLILEWAAKYGLITSTEEAPPEKTVASADEKASTDTSEAAASEKAPAKKSSFKALYERLKRDMDKEQEAIITAFTDMITPVGKALESIQGEISKSREIGAENVSLKAKVADLEKQLSEQRDRFQTVNQSLMAARTENEELRSRVSSLESLNTELDSKLNDAYAINNRESSLEAEKIRSELKKAFAFLYEDWLEYEFSDVSEDNYESLQAIIKKIFRSLERNGIDFKGNN